MYMYMYGCLDASKYLRFEPEEEDDLTLLFKAIYTASNHHNGP